MSLKSNVVGKMTRVMQGQNVNVVSRLVPQPTLAFSVHLTEHCNLNCKACAHFAPLVKNEGFTDIGEFTKDMERLSELSHGEMRYIDLLGGEPLLHPDIAAFLTVTRKCFPVGAVRLITNGLLLKKMKQDFWDAVAENRITIVISKYLETVDYDELIALIREKARGGYGAYYIDYTKGGFWSRDLDTKGQNNPVTSYLTCPMANNCHFLSNGKMYTCVKPANIHYFNEYFDEDIAVSEHDGIDIHEAMSLDEIMSFLAKPIPFCRYCNFSATVWTQGGQKSAKEIEEWVAE